MSIKHAIGWIVIAAWVTWCSNNPTTIKENTEDIKDSITNTTDTINKILIEVIDQDTVKPVLKGRHKNHRKINRLEWTNRSNPTVKDTISKKQRLKDIIRTHEARIEDWDNLKKYIEENGEQEYYTKNIISRDYEEYEEQEIIDYNPDEDELFVRKIKQESKNE